MDTAREATLPTVALSALNELAGALSAPLFTDLPSITFLTAENILNVLGFDPSLLNMNDDEKKGKEPGFDDDECDDFLDDLFQDLVTATSLNNYTSIPSPGEPSLETGLVSRRFDFAPFDVLSDRMQSLTPPEKTKVVKLFATLLLVRHTQPEKPPAPPSQPTPPPSPPRPQSSKFPDVKSFFSCPFDGTGGVSSEEYDEPVTFSSTRSPSPSKILSLPSGAPTNRYFGVFGVTEEHAASKATSGIIYAASDGVNFLMVVLGCH